MSDGEESTAEGTLKAFEVIARNFDPYASHSLAASGGSGEAGEWAGKCGACGAEYQHLPANDEGVCALCGCHSVEQIIKRIPLRPNGEFRRTDPPLKP